MNERDTSATYSREDRVKDFEAAFGDIRRVETDFLRFIDRLNLNSVAAR